jgi:uncharacterized SAM-binding protein YcdF (DUF218 family)
VSRLAYSPLTRLFAIVLPALAVLWLLAVAAGRWLVVSDSLPHADAALVLSGAPVYAARVRHGAALLKAGRVDRILLTDDGVRRGWSRSLQTNPFMIDWGVAELGRLGIPRNRVVVLDGRVSSTHDESIAVARYAAEHHLRSLTVVTSPYHTRRALWAVRRALAGQDVTVGSDPAWNAPDYTPPTFSWRLGAWRSLASELAKLPAYWILYR